MILRHMCGKPAIVDLSTSFKIVGIPAISGKKVKIVSMIAELIPNAKPQYFCTECNKTFGVDELRIVCVECGQIIEDNLINESPFGGIVCTECKDRFEINVKKINKKDLVLE